MNSNPWSVDITSRLVNSNSNAGKGSNNKTSDKNSFVLNSKR